MKLAIIALFVVLVGFGLSSDAFAETVTTYGPSDSVKTFNTTWKVYDSDLTFTIPVITSGIYSVDWGDGTGWRTFVAEKATHTYDKLGIYKVKMTGDISHIDMDRADMPVPIMLLSVDQWGDTKWTSMANMFLNSYEMHLNAQDKPDLSKVTDMSGMFSRTLFNEDISDWDVSNVTDMFGMFYKAKVFNQDLSNWDISNVKNMQYFLLKANSFSTVNYDKLLHSFSQQNVQHDVYFDASPKYCAKGAIANKILTDEFKWDIRDSGKDTNEICDKIDAKPFITTWSIPGDSLTLTIPVSTTGTYTVDWGDNIKEDITANQAVHTYDTAGNYTVKMTDDISQISFGEYSDSKKLISVDQWGNTKWTSMQSMFKDARNMDILATDTPDLSKVTDMNSMFRGATSFNGDLSKWDVSNVKNMSFMFVSADSFNGDLSNWDVSNVTTMRAMFAVAHSFNQDLSNWRISNVNTMEQMFDGAIRLSTINYEKILVSFSQQNVQHGVEFGSVSNYCFKGDNARSILIEKYDWTIIDGRYDSLNNCLVAYDFSYIAQPNNVWHIDRMVPISGLYIPGLNVNDISSISASLGGKSFDDGERMPATIKKLGFNTYLATVLDHTTTKGLEFTISNDLHGNLVIQPLEAIYTPMDRDLSKNHEKYILATSESDWGYGLVDLKLVFDHPIQSEMPIYTLEGTLPDVFVIENVSIANISYMSASLAGKSINFDTPLPAKIVPIDDKKFLAFTIDNGNAKGVIFTMTTSGSGIVITLIEERYGDHPLDTDIMNGYTVHYVVDPAKSDWKYKILDLTGFQLFETIN